MRSNPTVQINLNVLLRTDDLHRDSFKEMLDVEFKKLEQAQRVQREALKQQKNPDLMPNEFARDILHVLRTEIPALHEGRSPNELSTSDSSSPSRDQRSERPRSTTSAQPPRQTGNDQSFATNSNPGTESLPRRKVKVSRSTTRAEDPVSDSQLSN